MNIYTIAGIALLTAVMAFIFNEIKKEYAVIISICGGLIIFIWAVGKISEAAEYMNTLAQTGNISVYLTLIIKTLGIAFIVQAVSDICRDMGENSLAGKVEFAGKISIVILCLPVIKSVFDMGMELLT